MKSFQKCLLIKQWAYTTYQSISIHQFPEWHIDKTQTDIAFVHNTELLEGKHLRRKFRGTVVSLRRKKNQMYPLSHGVYRKSNLVPLIADKAIHLTTQISRYILSWKSSTRIKSISKVNGQYGCQTHNPGVISTLFPPAGLMLDPDLIPRKEATVILMIC